jgi:hypothetical protein
MSKALISKPQLIQAVIWTTIGLSALALIYHLRWFVDFLLYDSIAVVPTEQMPIIWFGSQIFNNTIFLFVGYMLIRHFNNYEENGFFDETSLKVFDGVILACVSLAVMGAIQVLGNNFSEVHILEWKSAESAINLFVRSFTKIFVFEGPQTIYFLIAIILWSVKQFVKSALFIKKENESFI